MAAIIILVLMLILMLVYEVSNSRERIKNEKLIAQKNDVIDRLAEKVGELEWKLAYANRKLEEARLRAKGATIARGEWPLPEDDGYHETHADLWDQREGK